MPRTRLPLFWRVFAVNAGLLTAIAVLLIVTPVTISTPIALAEAVVVIAGLLFTIAVNAVLLRRAFAPLADLAERMEMVDLLRPGQRLQVPRNDEVGRVVASFNRMLDRLETERRESGRRVLAAQEAERVGIARNLHDEVGQVLTGVLLQLNSIGEALPAHREELAQATRGRSPGARRGASDLERAATGDARAPRARECVDRAVEVVRACCGRAHRAPLRSRAAEARPGDRARRLPHRAGEPDEHRASRRREPGHDRARAGPPERRPARGRRRPRPWRRRRRERRPAEHARAGAAGRRRARDQGSARGRGRGAARGPGRRGRAGLEAR